MMTREDLAAVAPNNYKVLLENDRVRVVELTLHPGDSIPMHDHPDTVAYPLTDVDSTWTFPDGSQERVMMKKGEVFWHEAFSHGVAQTSDEEQKMILFEPKR